MIFLSGDLLFRRSWIAYADPTFAFFVFASIASYWLAYRQQRLWLLLPAVLLLAMAFLTKSLTCYVFYAVTVLVLFIQERHYKFIFHPVSILLHSAALLFPFVWLHYTDHLQNSSHRMLFDLYNQIVNFHGSIWKYLLGLLNKSWVYVLRFAPLSLLVIYCLLKYKQKLSTNKEIAAALIIVLLNIFPYWIAPQSWEIRYLLPLFPLIAVLFAYVLWNSGETIIRLSFILIAAQIALKVFVSPWGLPWFEHMQTGYEATAKEIITKARGYPIYADYPGPVIAALDSLRYPKSPLVYPPDNWDAGLVIEQYQIHSGYLIQNAKLKRLRLNLLCRGGACKAWRKAHS